MGFNKALNDNKTINNNYINRILCKHNINEINKSVKILNKRNDDEYNYNKYCQLYIKKRILF